MPKKTEEAEKKPKKEIVEEAVEAEVVQAVDEKAEEAVEEPVVAKPKRRGLEAVAHVHASKNNIILTVTDISGAETLATAAGGMVVKSGREERTPFAGIQVAKRVSEILKDKGVTELDIMLRGKGGHVGQKSPGRGASAVIKGLSRAGFRIKRIEDVTPIAHGGCKPPGGKRGRRV
jgi:small subunit ribosomal protein S11